MITKATTPAAPITDLHSILHTETNMDTPAARRAMQSGLLEAKQQAMRRAARLAKAGTPLLIGVIAVSFVHLWESVSVYKPAGVPELPLPNEIHYATAAAFTLAIDAVAYYAVACSNAAQFAGAHNRRRWAVQFFLFLTFALNAAFVIRHAPNLPTGFSSTALTALDLLFVVALPAFVPAAIVAVERAAHLVEAARLKLLVETTALAELVESGKRTEKGTGRINGNGTETVTVNGTVQPQTGSETADTLPDAIQGGRRLTYQIGSLLALLNDRDTINRAEVMVELGCGRTTADSLLTEAVEMGRLTKAGRGSYTITDTQDENGQAAVSVQTVSE